VPSRRWLLADLLLSCDSGTTSSFSVHLATPEDYTILWDRHVATEDVPARLGLATVADIGALTFSVYEEGR